MYGPAFASGLFLCSWEDLVMGKAFEINIDLDAKCDECGKGGRCANGLCLGCTSKAIAGKNMKSKTGKAVKDRANRIMSKN